MIVSWANCIALPHSRALCSRCVLRQCKLALRRKSATVVVMVRWTCVPSIDLNVRIEMARECFLLKNWFELSRGVWFIFVSRFKIVAFIWQFNLFSHCIWSFLEMFLFLGTIWHECILWLDYVVSGSPCLSSPSALRQTWLMRRKKRCGNFEWILKPPQFDKRTISFGLLWGDDLLCLNFLTLEHWLNLLWRLCGSLQQAIQLANNLR